MDPLYSEVEPEDIMTPTLTAVSHAQAFQGLKRVLSYLKQQSKIPAGTISKQSLYASSKK